MQRSRISITPQSNYSFKWLAIFSFLILKGSYSAFGQFETGRRSTQQGSRVDTASSLPTIEFKKPDSIVIRRYDPQFPVSYNTVPDSNLALEYVRFDPVTAYGPDNIYLNSLGQPAVLHPLLTTGYNRYRPLLQVPHPAYQDQPLPFFSQNVPFSYTAYNQGGEIDDGQVKVLFGRPFSNGWGLGISYDRTYQGGTSNRYPQSRAQRISFGVTLSHVNDSSHHRSYLSIDLNNRSWNNPGGYDIALDTLDEIITEPFTAVPRLNELRTEGKNSTYSYLHRYFVRQQLDSLPKGWAGSAQVTYKQARHRTSTTNLDSTAFGPFIVDDRGLRYAIGEKSLVGEAAIEYFTDPDSQGAISFNFQAGAYAGSQQFEADYLPDEDQLFLLGLKGRIKGQVFDNFTLDANTDLALGTRAGQGILEGSLSWKYRNSFSVSANALFERSSAPWAAEVVGINEQVIFSSDLPIGIHSQLGGSVNYLPLNISASAKFDLFTNATVYGAFGEPREARGETAIPSLSVNAPYQFGPLRFANRFTLRRSIQTSSLRLPAYSGQHSLYADFWVFERAMNLIIGVDGLVQSPTARYNYFPITNVFTVDAPSGLSPWQYNVDAFLAFKVQSFKAFLKMENILVNDKKFPPSSVFGYPLVRGNSIGGFRPLLRFGVAFFLLN